MTTIILGALAPVFGLILLGYFCGRYNVLGDRAFEVLNRFVIAITLPVLTFRSIATMDLSDPAVPVMLVAVIGGALATYAIGFAIERWLGRSGGEANIAALCACYSNTGFVGLPIALLAFGQGVIAPVAVAMLTYAAVVFTVGLIVSEFSANHGQGTIASLRQVGRSILRSPLIVLSVLGVAWSLLGLPLTGPTDVLLSTLAQATAPCALTAIGIFIALPRRDAEAGPIGRVMLLKLAVHPLLTALLLLALPPLPPLWASTAVLMAAMPCGASSFVLAGKAGRWSMELSAWGVTLTTTFAALSLLPVLMFLGA